MLMWPKQWATELWTEAVGENRNRVKEPDKQVFPSHFIKHRSREEADGEPDKQASSVLFIKILVERKRQVAAAEYGLFSYGISIQGTWMPFFLVEGK